MNEWTLKDREVYTTYEIRGNKSFPPSRIWLDCKILSVVICGNNWYRISFQRLAKENRLLLLKSTFFELRK